MFLLRRLNTNQYIFYKGGEPCFTLDKSKAARFVSQEAARRARLVIHIICDFVFVIESVND